MDAASATIELRGLTIDAVTRHQVIDALFDGLDEVRGGWIVTANVDHLQRHVADPAIARLNGTADLVVADGMPLLWAARLQGTPLPERVAGSDLVWLIATRAAETGRSIYLLGGNPGAAEGAALRLCEHAPGLRIAGTSSPRVAAPPAEDEIERVLADLRRAAPDIVYVALGAPKQEQLIAALRERLPEIWWIGVGISLSFITGEVRRAPRWMQRAGLEWVHRMAQEPGRLVGRYLLQNLPFTAALMARCLARRIGGRGRAPMT